MNGQIRHPGSWAVLATGPVSLTAGNRIGSIEDLVPPDAYDPGPNGFLVLEHGDHLWRVTITRTVSPHMHGGRLVGTFSTEFIVQGTYTGQVGYAPE